MGGLAFDFPISFSDPLNKTLYQFKSSTGFLQKHNLVRQLKTLNRGGGVTMSFYLLARPTLCDERQEIGDGLNFGEGDRDANAGWEDAGGGT